MSCKCTVGSKVSNRDKLFIVKKDAIIGEGNDIYFCESEDGSESRWILASELEIVELKVVK
jgi:hypothetical protein